MVRVPRRGVRTGWPQNPTCGWKRGAVYVVGLDGLTPIPASRLHSERNWGIVQRVSKHMPPPKPRLIRAK